MIKNFDKIWFKRTKFGFKGWGDVIIGFADLILQKRDSAVSSIQKPFAS